MNKGLIIATALLIVSMTFLTVEEASSSIVIAAVQGFALVAIILAIVLLYKFKKKKVS